MSICKNCGETIEMGQTILFEGNDKVHGRCKKPERIECFACGCRIYPEQSLYPRPKDPMHMACGNEGIRVAGFLIQSGEQVSYESGFALKWPANLLSDEWKDFHMECRKRDRAEVDKARGPSPRAKELEVPVDKTTP